MSLAEAVERTLYRHPALEAAALEVDIERARREFESQPPPLEFEAGAEDFGGTGAVSGFDGAELTLQLSRVLELGDKATLRYDVGTRRVDQALVVEQTAALELAREVTHRYLEVVVLQERVTLARQMVRVAASTLEFVTARVKAGGSARAEASLARVELSRAELAVLGVDGQLDAARTALASMWQASPPDFGRAGADIYQLPGLPSYASLEQRLDDNPALLQRAAEVNLLRAQSQLVNARQKADVSVTGGVKHLAATDDVGFVFSVSVPFGSASRAKPSITESELLSEQTPLLVESQTIELRTTLSGLYSELLYADQAVDRLQEDIIPEAKTAVRLYEDTFRIGSSTLLELTQAQKELLALQEELVAIAGTYHSTLMEIEYLLGAGYEAQP